jgi:hypothetical protein
MPFAARLLAAIFATLLLCAPPFARAERVVAKLQVNVQVVVSCRLDAKVPAVGSPQRATAGASFRVQCTRGSNAIAAACAPGCAAPAATQPARSEYRAAETSTDGITVATVLF